MFLTTFPLNWMVGRTFVPTEDMGEWTVHLDAPEGHVARGIDGDRARPGEGAAGHRRRGAAAADDSGARDAHPSDRAGRCRSKSARSRRSRWSPRCGGGSPTHPGLRPSITNRNPLGGGESGGFPISAALLGPDLDVLADYSLKALAEAQKLPSLADPKVSLNIANPEIRVAVDRRRAADLGVRMQTVGDALRLMVAGDDEISNYREGSEQYPVKMRVLENQRGDIDAIGKLTVASSRGELVRIDNIAKLERGLGPSTLQRFNRQFSVNLNSDLAPGHALDRTSDEVRKILDRPEAAAGLFVRMSGQTKILDETTGNLILAIGLASIFVYMVLAAQFESFIQPIVIMTVLPLSVPFALFTLWATGRTLNLWSALGVLLLLGHRQEELDPAGRLRERAARAGARRARGDRRSEPHASASDPDDDVRDSRGPGADGARHRHRRPAARGDCRDDHRRPVALPVPDAAAGAGGLRQVRRARTVVVRPALQRRDAPAERRGVGASALPFDVASNSTYKSRPHEWFMEWLLDSDPAIRWQVMRDLVRAPADEVAAERARVATRGLGRQAAGVAG